MVVVVEREVWLLLWLCRGKSGCCCGCGEGSVVVVVVEERAVWWWLWRGKCGC